jgi:hypothetical protein
VNDVGMQEPDPRIEIVWEQAQANLTRQFAGIDELRARVGTLIAAWAVATGFLASQAVDGHHLKAGVWLGLSSSVLFVALCVFVLVPREWEGESIDINDVLVAVDDYPNETLDEFRRRMAGYAQTHFTTNSKRLKWLYRALTAALLALCGDLGGWIWALNSR